MLVLSHLLVSLMIQTSPYPKIFRLLSDNIAKNRVFVCISFSRQYAATNHRENGADELQRAYVTLM